MIGWGAIPGIYIADYSARLQVPTAKFRMPRQLRDTALPKTGTGKALKRELRETLWSGKDQQIQG